MRQSQRKSATALVRCVLLWAGLAGNAVPALAYEVGVFFDPQGQSCVGEIRPFGRADVYVLAFLDREVDFSGALLSLRLPGDVAIVGGQDGVVWPRDTTPSGDLLSDTGVNLQFQLCPRLGGVVELCHMTLEDISSGVEPRPNLLIDVGGAVSPADSLLKLKPQLRVCDDQDPGGFGQLVEATGLRATLNCTSECPCSVGVRPFTWSAVKRRFQEE